VLRDGRAGGLEDADPAVAFDVEQPGEGFGLCDPETVARQEAEPAALPQELAEVRLEAIEAARHDEAHGDVGRRGSGQLLAKVAEEGILPAADRPERSRVGPHLSGRQGTLRARTVAGCGMLGEIVGTITDIETIAARRGIRDIDRSRSCTAKAAGGR
jgi:hypothetical protein